MIKMALTAVTAICFSWATTAPLAHADQVTVGIGNITNTFDSTSESFSLANYLLEHPSAESPRSVRVVLVDHPNDAPLSVTGTIGGTYRLDWEGNTPCLFAGFPPYIPFIIWCVAHKEAKLEYSHSLDLNFWRNGRKVDSLKGPYGDGATTLPPDVLAGKLWRRRWSPEIRESALDPIWALVSDRLNRIVEEGGVGQ